MPADKLGAVTPDSLDGFDASGPAEGREVALDNGGKLIGTRRIYRRGSQQLILEISDTLHAPEVRALVTHARGFDRSTPRGSFKGVEVQGHGGVSQWQGPTNAAVTNVLVDGRFMVNVKVRPADSAAPALELANKLLLASLRALAASDAGTAGTAPDARVQEPGGGTKSGGAKPPKASAPAAPKAAPGKTPAPSDDGAQTK